MVGTKINSIDIFKFLCALMVVGIHTQPFGERLGGGYYATTIFRIAVPFFFAVSSYLFFNKEKPDIIRYVKRILLLDIAWTVFQSPYIIYKYYVISPSSVGDSTLDLVQSMLVGESYMGSWYIHASWLGLLLLYLSTKYLRPSIVMLITTLCFMITLLDSSYRFVWYNIDYQIVMLGGVNSFSQSLL